MNKDELIETLKKKGFSDKILSAFSKVNRENFVPENMLVHAQDDIALPIEDGVTLSQPSTIALMLSLLSPEQGQKILEVGSGSGYVLALLSEIIKDGKIYGLEINSRLAIKSKKVLINRSIIEIINRDGSVGLLEFAPFDRILVSFSCPDKYIPSRLIDQLSPNGTLIVPINQSIFKFTKTNGVVSQEEFPGYAFVPVRKLE
jgi:protein-L-isoaspartate(D-aspartate) O-methyltransferase